MPELVVQCTPTPAPPPVPPGLLPIPPEADPPAVPPLLDPAAWEDFSVFRETFLMYVTEPAYNAALRKIGEFLFTMVLEYYDNWPALTESSTRTELRAAVADLRHLEGFLGSVGREHRLSSLSSEDTALSQSAARVAVEVGKLADRIEHELATGQGHVR
jgi:hypothetical protein